MLHIICAPHVLTNVNIWVSKVGCRSSGSCCTVILKDCHFATRHILYMQENFHSFYYQTLPNTSNQANMWHPACTLAYPTFFHCLQVLDTWCCKFNIKNKDDNNISLKISLLVLWSPESIGKQYSALLNQPSACSAWLTIGNNYVFWISPKSSKFCTRFSVCNVCVIRKILLIFSCLSVLIVLKDIRCLVTVHFIAWYYFIQQLQFKIFKFHGHIRIVSAGTILKNLWWVAIRSRMCHALMPPATWKKPQTPVTHTLISGLDVNHKILGKNAEKYVFWPPIPATLTMCTPDCKH